MTDLETLVQTFVSVWNESDAAQRTETVQRLWRADGRHLMGGQDVRGHAALTERVTSSHQRNVVERGYVFRPATAIQTLPGVVKFRWDMARRDTEEMISAGVGFLELDRDGKIACDYLFTEV
jgi:hypothetical protein